MRATGAVFERGWTVDLESQQIVNTDLFRVFSPQGSTINIGAGYSCKFSDVPAIGERVVVDDDSAVAIPDGQFSGKSLPLRSMRGDQMLSDYFFGLSMHKTSYRITFVDSGLWSPEVDALRKAMGRMSGEKAWSEELTHHMGYCGGAVTRLMNLRHAGVYRCALMRMFDPDVKGILDKLQSTPPPVRASIPLEGGSRGASLLYVVSALKGAEILVGWKNSSGYGRMHGERQAISLGMMSAITAIVGSSAHAGHWYGANDFMPFGMTGDIQGLRIDANVPALCVSDWGRTDARELWSIVREKLGPVGVERLFAEGAIAASRAKSPPDRLADPDPVFQGTNAMISAVNDPEMQKEYHCIENDTFLVHHMKINDGLNKVFRVAPGSPTTFVALRGRITINSPANLTVALNPYDAAFVPAAICGDFMVGGQEGSAEFLAVQGVPRSRFVIARNPFKI